MKVLHVVPSFYPAFVYGGPITSVYELCAGLARNGCQVRVLTTDANGRDSVLDVEKDRPLELVPGLTVRYCRRLGRNFTSPQLLRQLPAEVRWADVVHVTAVYNFPTFPTLAACRWMNKPLLWSPRGALQRWESSRRRTLKSLWEFFCRPLLPAGTVLHVTSEQEAEESREKLGSLPAVVIPNGVELPAEVNHRDRNGQLRLLFLGRIDPKKGIENLLAACRMLNQTFGRSWTLAIAGSGDPDYTESLQQRTLELQLNEQVRFVGEARGEAKRSLLAGSDLAVFPSHTENFGMVVAEALAHGVPVIASKGMPWRELESQGCGLWVENDPATLAAAIQRMSTMPLAEMGRRGRQWMAQDFSWERVVRDMTAVYVKLLPSSV